MFRQIKFAVPSEFFLVTFADCSSNLVACRHFTSLMLLFQRHVARRNLPYQGLIMLSNMKLWENYKGKKTNNVVLPVSS